MLHTSLNKRIWTFAENAPEKVILQDSNRHWTWRDLLWRAQAYAKVLGEGDDGRGASTMVPILVGRTGDTVAAILGVVMAGRGFAPLSPNQPAARLFHCFEALDARDVIIPDGGGYSGSDAIKNLRNIVLGNHVSPSGLPPAPSAMPLNQILYVLFTSGSTGVPKGVMADCSNIENTMLWSMDMLDWRPDDVIGCCTNFFFDISMFDVFSMFYFGVPFAIYSNPSDVAQVVEETTKFRITSVFGVPTFFSQILRRGMIEDPRLSSLRRIVAGGDFFPPAHVIGWRNARPETEIYNVWGPTETSIVNTMHRVTDADVFLLSQGRSPPVGKAHPRMPLCLIDESGVVLTEPNQRGEICMLGACVTQGYAGDPERTKQAYITIGDVRAFRTQDIGYVNDNGDLFIVGRMGATVKVAGHRIDLGEVESAAVTIPNIHLACACVVDIDSESGDRELWVVLESKHDDEAVDIYSVKKALRALLPPYMVPKRIFVSPTLPRNANGKIDRTAVTRHAIGEAQK